MRTLSIISILLFALLFGSFAYSADFQKGLDVALKRDFATALQKWMPLAEQGHASAQYNLGVMYDNGHGVPQDGRQAVKWYRLAAEQGHADAQHSLGVMYRNGDGVPQDYREAVKWYRLAAGQRHASAQNNLGLMYALGRGLIKDNVYAHMWANIASANGAEDGRKLRETMAKKMTSADISKAQDLARECIKKNFKNC